MIHGFYDEVQDHFINKVIIAGAPNDRGRRDSGHGRINFTTSADASFDEYGEKFKQDILDPMSMSCPER